MIYQDIYILREKNFQCLRIKADTLFMLREKIRNIKFLLQNITVYGEENKIDVLFNEKNETWKTCCWFLIGLNHLQV